MRDRFFALGLAALTLTGCSADQSGPGAEHDGAQKAVLAFNGLQPVNALVDTFDVPSCLGSTLRYSGRKDVGQWVFHQRHFDASEQCLRDLGDAADRLGFTSDGAGQRRGNIIDGVEERLILQSDQYPNKGNLLWEVEVT